jgi:hypothetical protein
VNRRHLPSRSIRIVAVTTALVIGALAGSSRPAPAGASGAQLAFNPLASNVGVGGTVNVDVTVASVTDLGGYDLALQFNPALVHLVSLTDAGFVTTPPSGNLVTCVAATINNSTGTATKTCLTLFSATLGPPVPGTGVSAVGATALIHAQFTGVGVGVASLTLSGTTLQGPTGTNIPVTLGTGSITVTATSSVGGIAQQPDLAALRSSASSRGGRATAYMLDGALLAMVAVLGAGGWYLRQTRVG